MTVIDRPLHGDLILCRSDAGAKANLTGQRLARPTGSPRFSHAAIVAGPNYVIHSMPEGGVHFAGIHEFLLESEYSGNWQVFRNRALAANATHAYWSAVKSISEACDYFVAQDYSYAILVPNHLLTRKDQNRSFCSQLVYRIYDRIQEPLGVTTRESSAVLPIDLQEAVERSGLWDEVTTIYDMFLKPSKRDADLRKAWIASDKQSYSIREKQIQLDVTMANKLVEIAAGVRAIEKAFDRVETSINSAAQRVGVPKIQSPPPRSLDSIDAALRATADVNWRASLVLNEFEKLRAHSSPDR